MNLLRDNTTLFRVWNGTGAATILLPLIIFGVARLSNSQGNGDGENQNNNNEYNDNYYNDCRWYQWNCSNNYNQQGEERQQENTAPWWWFGGEERRREDGPSAALILVYCWSLVMFCTILKMGCDGVINGQDRAVSASLIVFANLCFLMMILLSGVEGIVESEGPQLEENGFYGQMGVLLYLSYFMWLIWSLVFVFLIRKRSQTNVTKIEIEPSDYQIHSDRDENEVRTVDATAV